MTISLCVNDTKENHTIDFKDIDGGQFGRIPLKTVRNVIVTNVPDELEYEVSKYVFNRIELVQIKWAQAELLAKIKGN